MRSEREEQLDFIRWFKFTFPDHKFYAVPNGSVRTKKAAVQLKNEGMSRGVPDLCIPFLMLYIEMKTVKSGKVSPEQKEWIEYLQSVNHTAVVAKGAEEAKRIVLDLVEQRKAQNEL